MGDVAHMLPFLASLVAAGGFSSMWVLGISIDADMGEALGWEDARGAPFVVLATTWTATFGVVGVWANVVLSELLAVAPSFATVVCVLCLATLCAAVATRWVGRRTVRRFDVHPFVGSSGVAVTDIDDGRPGLADIDICGHVTRMECVARDEVSRGSHVVVVDVVGDVCVVKSRGT